MSIGNTWSDEINESGAFVREVSSFRSCISKDPSNPFQPENDRYHLYVSYACPWAHRCLTTIALKGLEDCISVSVVGTLLGPLGWGFIEETTLGLEGCTVDHVLGVEYLREIYMREEGYTGRITVPVLFDKKLMKIVNNESSDIIKILNCELNEFAKNAELDLYPEELVEKIEEMNELIYESVNNGVYKCGFATKQKPYEDAFHILFNTLDVLEDILSKSRYLTGGRLTLADVRLWTTLIRFDPVYHGHFKCNKKKLIEYPNLWAFTRDIYQQENVATTVNMEHIRVHYYYSHTSINPTRVVPIGPQYDYNEPHYRT